MLRLKKLACLLCLFWGMQTSAHAQLKEGEIRGELLYAMYCNACHTSQIHWREKKLATDWHSLKAQVRLWQANAGLGWGEEEISDVTHYLNAVYYHFSVTSKNDLPEDKKSNHVLLPN